MSEVRSYLFAEKWLKHGALPVEDGLAGSKGCVYENKALL
jgi:hypothetical protein